MKVLTPESTMNNDAAAAAIFLGKNNNFEVDRGHARHAPNSISYLSQAVIEAATVGDFRSSMQKFIERFKTSQGLAFRHLYEENPPFKERRVHNFLQPTSRRDARVPIVYDRLIRHSMDSRPDEPLYLDWLAVRDSLTLHFVTKATSLAPANSLRIVDLIKNRRNAVHDFEAPSYRVPEITGIQDYFKRLGSEGIMRQLGLVEIATGMGAQEHKDRAPGDRSELYNGHQTPDFTDHFNHPPIIKEDPLAYRSFHM